MRKLKNGLLKRLSRGTRELVAKKPACYVENVVQANDHHVWNQLLHFAPRYLKLPKSGSRHESLTSAISKQIRDDLNDATTVSGSTFGQKVVKRIPEDPLKL